MLRCLYIKKIKFHILPIQSNTDIAVKSAVYHDNLKCIVMFPLSGKLHFTLHLSSLNFPPLKEKKNFKVQTHKMRTNIIQIHKKE